ncbi:28S rRNA (cytosine-C(5))-methyltransferase isoform X3 [Bradysia coprophila]|uniref:28S rRNA (cytosine-C(5))-methyltransferase isoform X3 n=1 Tax=Bradysia coprophila TaxID=38358 RepID=UPI00187D9964|nr:28S rRNA (cytosine-C(5))-methyltransferase isoform X3 [Bradysia coprophila]
MEEKFIHSIKVPNQYKKAAKLLKQTFESGQSVKGQIFEQKHVITNRLYALIAKISKNKPKLDLLIEKSSILRNEPRLDQYMCLVLMTELLFGAQKLNGQSKPVQCVLGYESKFQDILKDINSDPANSTLQSIDVVKPRYVRVNTNILSRAEALELFVKDGWNEIAGEFTDYDKFLDVVRNLGDSDFVSDMHVKNLFVFPANSKKYWAKYASGDEKTFILQDKASCLPVTLLDPPKGSTVLDMCAAPGMKTTHLAAHIRNKGKIYAVERDERRYKTLSEFVDGTKSSSVSAIHLDALLLEDDFVPNVEYILVDPSCSGSGMTNRLFVSAEKDPDRLGNLTGLQSRMLSHAMRAFTKAKKIVYSTCSIHPEENEKVVQECLEMCPDWKLIKPIEFAEQWKHFGSPKFKHIGKKCVYAKSEIDLTDGFFVAIFEREIDPSISIQPYSRDNAFLERISFNIKRKYPTETTTNLEKNETISQETVDLTFDEGPNGTVTENGKKKKKKSKDDEVVDEVNKIKQELTDVDATINRKTENGTELEEEMVTHKTEREENSDAGKRKKKKQKVDQEAELLARVRVKTETEETSDAKKRKKEKGTVDKEAELPTPAIVKTETEEESDAKKCKKKKRSVDEAAELLTPVTVKTETEEKSDAGKRKVDEDSELFTPVTVKTETEENSVAGKRKKKKRKIDDEAEFLAAVTVKTETEEKSAAGKPDEEAEMFTPATIKTEAEEHSDAGKRKKKKRKVDDEAELITSVAVKTETEEKPDVEKRKKKKRTVDDETPTPFIDESINFSEKVKTKKKRDISHTEIALNVKVEEANDVIPDVITTVATGSDSIKTTKKKSKNK